MKKPTLKQALLMLIVAIIVNTIYASCRQPKGDWAEVPYTVTQGETLWTIAEQYCPEDMDMRDYIYAVKQLNNMDTSTVYEWQTITLLTLQNDAIDASKLVDIQDRYTVTIEDGNYYELLEGEVQ